MDSIVPLWYVPTHPWTIMSTKRRQIDDDIPTSDLAATYDSELQPILKKLKSTHLDVEVLYSAPSYIIPEQRNPCNGISRLGSSRSPNLLNGCGTVHDKVERMDITYEPELDEAANPFYYSSNKLLHDAFVDRTRREKS